MIKYRDDICNAVQKALLLMSSKDAKDSLQRILNASLRRKEIEWKFQHKLVNEEVVQHIMDHDDSKEEELERFFKAVLDPSIRADVENILYVLGKP